MIATQLKPPRQDGERANPAGPSAMDRRIERRLVTPRRIAMAAAGAALAGLTAYAYVEFGSTRTLTINDQRITTAHVEQGTFLEYVPVSGNIAPRTTYYLDAVAGGQVTDVYVENGAVVEAGQPLLRLENTDLQLQVISAEAQLTEQLSYLSSTQLELERNRLQHRRELIDIDYRIDQLTREISRMRGVVGTGGATESQIDDLEAELTYQKALREAVAEAQELDQRSQSEQIERLQGALETMNENLDIARSKLSNLVITAPISGQLTTLEAHVGESKSAGQRLGQIDEMNAFKVTSFIDEFYLGRVALGQRATVEIGGQQHNLEVAKIYPDVNDRQFQVDFAIVGTPPQRLRRGQTVRMRLQIGEPVDTLMLANGAFYNDTGGQWVYVVDQNTASATRRTVRFGRRNPDAIEVLDGLNEGDEIITSSYDNFADFDVVRW